MPVGSSDPRFAGVATDPRFRRPKQKNVKVEIDERFRQVLESDEFGGQGIATGKKGKRLDKYGRPLATSHHQDQLKHFYRFKSPEAGEEAQPEASSSKAEASATFVDFARGEGNLESSGSEDGSDDDADSDSGGEGEIEVGNGKRHLKIPGRDLDTDDEDDDEEEGNDLDIDLSEDDEDAANAQAIVDAAKKASASKGKEKPSEAVSSFPTEEEIQQADAEAEELEEAELIEPTKRIAVVNLDWDNMRAIDLYTVFHSVLNSYRPDARKSRGDADPLTARKKVVVPRGKLLNVRVFPSEFGKERMAREEQEGPAAEVFGTRFAESRNGKGKSASRSRRSAVEEDEEESQGDEEEFSDELLEDGSDDEAGQDSAFDEDEEVDELESSNEEDEEYEDGGDPVGLDMEGDDLSETSDVPEGDVDMDKLRAYQLERLRYYYAIATFSDVSASEYIMAECNGTEFERTANVFDMMYVPDDTEFDVDESRDEATEEVKGYKGNDFVTDALRHSKVKLTWDQDDPNRVKVLRRAMTKQEIEEDDFKAYLASSTDDDGSDLEDEGVPNQPSQSTKSKEKKAKLGSKALRDLLLNGGDDEADVWGKHGGTGNPFGAADEDDKAGGSGDMEITFKSGLTIKGGDSKAAGGEDEEDLTTIERYRRRMKEKMSRKKEKKELRAGTRATKDAETSEGKQVARTSGEVDEFFNDDDAADEGEFLQDEPEPPRQSKKASSKTDKIDKRSGKPQATEPSTSGETAATAKELDALAGIDEAKHFSMQDIIKAEKDAGKKKRKRNKKSKAVEKEVELGDEGFDINVKDDRFKVLHEEPAFAIDPSNPHFVKTKGMSKLLQEGTKRRQEQAAVTAAQALQQTQSKQKKAPTGAQPSIGLPQVVAATSAVGSTATSGSGDQSLLDLVANVKRKLGDETATGDTSGSKKKRRRR